MYYVYRLTHSKIDQSLYIGVSQNPEKRLQQHLVTNKDLRNLLDELSEPPESIEQEIIDSALTLKLALQIERDWIIKEVPMLNRQHNGKLIKQVKEQELCCDIFNLLEPFIEDWDKRNQATWNIVDYMLEEEVQGNGKI